MKRAVEVVMFDLDGTLADTGRDLANAVNYTRAQFELPSLPDSTVLSHVGRGVEHLLKQTLPAKSPEQFQQIMKVFLDRYEEHLLDTTVLYPGVSETLRYFANKHRVVVSNKMHYLTVAVLRGLGIDDQFDAVIGGDSGLDKKPDPALLQLVLDRFAVPARRAVMVGDAETDVQAGKRAGVVTCGVTYGLGKRDALVAAGPDILIDDLVQLAQYFY